MSFGWMVWEKQKKGFWSHKKWRKSWWLVVPFYSIGTLNFGL